MHGLKSARERCGTAAVLAPIVMVAGACTRDTPEPTLPTSGQISTSPADPVSCSQGAICDVTEVRGRVAAGVMAGAVIETAG